MRTLIMAAGLAVLSLTACGQAQDKGGAQETAATGATTSSATSAVPEGPAPGLWRMTSNLEGAPAGMAMPSIETCITNEKFEPPVRRRGDPTAGGAPGVECTNAAFRREGDVMIGSATCTLPDGGTSETTTRVSGDYTRSYQMDVTSKITMAGQATQESKMSMKAERIGDCPAKAPAAG